MIARAWMLVLAMAAMTMSQSVMAAKPEKDVSIVLVHGAFVDGSGWKEVFDRLTAEGYETLVVQHSTDTLEGDVATTNDVIDAARFPVVLVGHSYGGMVITEAGRNPKVKKLVYVAAYAPETGESVAKIAQLPVLPGESRAPLLPPRNEHLLVDPAKFPAAFAADVPLATSRFMAAAQVPWGVAAVRAEIGEPAWKSKPAWYLLTKRDRMIPPSVQQLMAKRSGATKREIESSHAVMLSHPRDVMAFIEESVRAP